MNIFLILNLFISLFLIFFIIIQTGGKGFGRTVGSLNTSFAKRGLERYVFRITFILAFLFIVVSILQVVA